MNAAEFDAMILALGREAKIEDTTRIGVRVETARGAYRGRHYWPAPLPIVGIRDASNTYAVPISQITAFSVYELPR